MVRMCMLTATAAIALAATGASGKPTDATLHYCIVTGADGNVYYSQPFTYADDDSYVMERRARQSGAAEYGAAIANSQYVNCYANITQAEYDRAIAHSRETLASRGKTVALFTFSAGETSKSRTASTPVRKESSASTVPTRDELAPAPAPKSVVTNEYGLPQTAEKKAKYEAEMAAYKRSLDEQAAAADRARAQRDANARAIAQARADYEAKLVESNRQQQEYFAAQERHAKCLGGDTMACADISAGRPVTVAAAASPGKASTDTDARTCVSGPTVGPSPTYKGQTSAVIVNGCKTAVDVRICLMREGGWNCGVQWGIQPTDRWTWNSFKASGEVFWDARVSGSSTPLASPPAS